VASVVTWYDVLGVLPDARLDDIRDAWQARTDLLELSMSDGLPADVLSVVDRARQTVEEAWRVLADPAARESYDEEHGLVRAGGGLATPYLEPSGSADLPHRVVVPDVTGLFYRAGVEVAGRFGLHVAPVQLTAHPMPVEGLVVGQAPAPGQHAHRDSTLTVRVWHPPESG
jgi:curved DNA-binding protein CbpA